MAHPHAPVYRDNGAGHVGGFVRGQPAYDPGHFGGLAETLEGYLSQHVGPPRLSERGRHVGLDKARGHNVDGYVAATYSLAPGCGQSRSGRPLDAA